eukprot:tig00021591_g22792.t1
MRDTPPVDRIRIVQDGTVLQRFLQIEPIHVFRPWNDGREFATSRARDAKIRLPLSCIYANERIRVPVQSVYCVHPHCFDFNEHLIYSLHNEDWICPFEFCQRQAGLHDLIIDEFFESILAGTSDADLAVEIDNTGQWLPCPSTNLTE